MTICAQIASIPAPESSIRLVKQDQIGHRSFLAHRKQLLALARVLSGLRACNQDLRSQGWKSISVILSHSHTYFYHLVLHSKIWKINVISDFSFLISLLISCLPSFILSELDFLGFGIPQRALWIWKAGLCHSPQEQGRPCQPVTFAVFYQSV